MIGLSGYTTFSINWSGAKGLGYAWGFLRRAFGTDNPEALDQIRGMRPLKVFLLSCLILLVECVEYEVLGNDWCRF